MIRLAAENADTLLAGMLVTAQLAGIAILGGICGGGLFGFAASRSPDARLLLRVGNFLLSGLPVLVLLFWLYYPVQSGLGMQVSAFWTSAIVLLTVNVFVVAARVHSAINEIPSQFITAAVQCGLPQHVIARRIQAPLIVQAVIPPLLIQQVVILHSTLFAGLISTPELFRVSQRLVALEHRSIEIYSLLALLMLALSLPINALAIWVRRRSQWSLDEL